MNELSALSLATGHLNASVGSALHPDELAAALRNGSAHMRDTPPLARALIQSMFVELAPEMIVRCALEAQANLRQADALYRETLADALPRVPGWEQSVEHLL